MKSFMLWCMCKKIIRSGKMTKTGCINYYLARNSVKKVQSTNPKPGITRQNCGPLFYFHSQIILPRLCWNLCTFSFIWILSFRTSVPTSVPHKCPHKYPHKSHYKCPHKYPHKYPHKSPHKYPHKCPQYFHTYLSDPFILSSLFSKLYGF